MARARMLAKEASTDPQLNQISEQAQLLYLLSIPHLDRDGLISGNPQVLWGTAAILRIELLGSAPRLVQEWVDIGLVIRYNSKDGPVLFFKGFRKHNANMPYPNEEASKYPPPPGWVRTRQGLVPDDEEGCFRLMDSFDKRSLYRKELELRVSRDLLATRSQSGHYEDQDQVEDQVEFDDDDDGFLCPLILLVWSRKINTHDPRVLTEAMRILAARWMLTADWQGAASYLKQLDDQRLCYLLCWLAQLPANASEVFEWSESPAFAGAKNPVGLIKWHIEITAKHPKPTEPELSLSQLATLAAYALWHADSETGLWYTDRWDYIDRIPYAASAQEEPTQ